MKKTLLALGAALLVFAAFGCSGEEQASSKPTDVAQSQPKPVGGGGAAPAGAPEPTPGPGPSSK